MNPVMHMLLMKRRAADARVFAGLVARRMRPSGAPKVVTVRPQHRPEPRYLRAGRRFSLALHEQFEEMRELFRSADIDFAVFMLIGLIAYVAFWLEVLGFL